MVTKAKTPPAAKKPGTALTLWEQEMKGVAAKQAASEQEAFGGYARVNITGGQMMIDGHAVEGNSMDVVVLASAWLNEYYSSVYNPAKPTVPDCYAYSSEDMEDPETEMAPSDDVEDKQGDDNGKCEECWANKMGSADTGRGKACKNGRRLLVMTDDSLEDASTIEGAEARSLSVPVMSVRNWSKYVKEVLAEELTRPCYGVVTTVKVVPDPKSQFKITFAFKELINFDQSTWDAMKHKVAGAVKDIVAPYPKQADLEAAQAGKVMKPTGKAAQMMNKGKPAAKGKPAPAPAKKSKF